MRSWVTAATAAGETRAACAPPAMSRRSSRIPLPSAVPDGFTIHDFQIDRQAGTASCPAGHSADHRSGQASFARWCRAARCAGAAPPPSMAARSTSTPTRTSCAPPAAERTRSFQQSYRRWRPWWNGRSPGWSPTAAGGCPTAGSSATSCGGRCASPRSTCAACWCLALPTRWRLGAGLSSAVTAPRLHPNQGCQRSPTAASPRSHCQKLPSRPDQASSAGS